MQGWGFEEDYVEKLQFFAKVQGPADEKYLERFKLLRNHSIQWAFRGACIACPVSSNSYIGLRTDSHQKIKRSHIKNEFCIYIFHIYGVFVFFCSPIQRSACFFCLFACWVWSRGLLAMKEDPEQQAPPDAPPGSTPSINATFTSRTAGSRSSVSEVVQAYPDLTEIALLF